MAALRLETNVGVRDDGSVYVQAVVTPQHKPVPPANPVVHGRDKNRSNLSASAAQEGRYSRCRTPG